MFELDLGPVALAFTGASTEQDHALMDTALAAHGAGAFADSWLRAKWLDWAAALIGTEHPTSEETNNETTA